LGWGEWECKEAVHQLIADFKKAYNSVRRKREVLYNILMEFDVPTSLVKKNLYKRNL
jgi:23S rRNA C2498 (ribose-2'-O)-methylase RlmM